MKIPEGKTIYVGGHEYTDEIPDAVAKAFGIKFTTEPVMTAPSKPEKATSEPA